MTRTEGAARWPTGNLSADALVRKVLSEEHVDLIKQVVSFFCQELMEAEVSAQIGAGLGERAPRRARPPRW